MHHPRRPLAYLDTSFLVALALGAALLAGWARMGGEVERTYADDAIVSSQEP